MNGRIKIKKIINICLYPMIFLLVISAVSATARLWINSVNSYGGVGSTFTKDVVISDVTDLAGYDFNVSWNPNVLNCIDIAKYPPWNPFFAIDYFDNNQGRYEGVRVALPPIQGFSNIGGSYTLVTLTFTVISTGTSSIDISNDMLANVAKTTIDHTVTGGYFYSTSPTPSSTTTTTRQTTSTTTSTSTSTTTPTGCPSGKICCGDVDCLPDDISCFPGTSQGQCSSVYHFLSCSNCISSTTSTSTSTSTTTRQTTTSTSTSTSTTTRQTTSTSTSTTTRQTTSTSTSTISGFTGTNFVCNYVQTNNVWECSLDYTNNMNQRVIVKFHFVDSVSSEVISTGSIWTDMSSSGTAGSELSCSNYHGTYYVVWRAFKDSDTAHSNPVAFSTTFNSVTCT